MSDSDLTRDEQRQGALIQTLYHAHEAALRDPIDVAAVAVLLDEARASLDNA